MENHGFTSWNHAMSRPLSRKKEEKKEKKRKNQDIDLLTFFRVATLAELEPPPLNADLVLSCTAACRWQIAQISRGWPTVVEGLLIQWNTLDLCRQHVNTRFSLGLGAWKARKFPWWHNPPHPIISLSNPITLKPKVKVNANKRSHKIWCLSQCY